MGVVQLCTTPRFSFGSGRIGFSHVIQFSQKESLDFYTQVCYR